jgi:hypothetical protein
VSLVSFVVSARWIWLGAAIMIASEAATLARIEPFWSWNTPIAWTGFIIFADAIVWRARGTSWIRSSPREFAALALVSIPLWVVFEGFNLRIRNWHYVGLPEDPLLRYFGYAWSFATIWPAIFEAADLMSVARDGFKTPMLAGADLGRPLGGVSSAPTPRSLETSFSIGLRFSGAKWISILAGALLLASPFVVSPAVARYLAAPVWLGFIFLLDPINARLGAESLWNDLRGRRIDRLVNLSLSGFLCGVLWEFWNYWSRAKWHYTVPVMEHLKIFEMPVPGYLGFPAFAFECFTMYVFLRALLAYGTSAIRRTATTRLGRTIAL